ncbi:hypothetical protein D3C81_1081610 [compost metagenome]
MPHRLHEHEAAVQHERHQPRERQLRRGQHRPRRGAREIGQHHGQHQQRHQHGHRGLGAGRLEFLLPVVQAAHEQAHADDAVADDHHGGEHGVSSQSGLLRPGGQHDRDDQRHLDHRHRNRQHQRAERLAHLVGHHLGMVHRGKHRAGQRGSHDRNKPALARQHQPEAKRGPRGQRRPDGPCGQFVRCSHPGSFFFCCRASGD